MGMTLKLKDNTHLNVTQLEPGEVYKLVDTTSVPLVVFGTKNYTLKVERGAVTVHGVDTAGNFWHSLDTRATFVRINARLEEI